MSDGLTSLATRFGGTRRVATIATGVAAVALVLLVSRWATTPTWVPVASGLPLEATGNVTDQLDQAGIAYRLERGGLDVVVPASDLARARVVLARSGLPAAGRPGMELFDKPAYAMTDFTQRVNYRRALEGELERTIGRMRNVEAAQVHLAMHESSSFRRNAAPREASVVLTLRGGETPPPDVVRGIAQLVASSVDGLASEQVTVLDASGRVLTAANESLSPEGLSARQLVIQQEIESHLREKATGIVEQIVGPGNARVQVAATVNFDRVERTTQVLDPERQVTATEQKAEIIPGAEGGAASTNQATTYENSRSTEIFAPAPGSVQRLTVAVLVNERSAEGAAAAGRTAEELQRIELLVRNAVGFDAARGDQVSVVAIPFAVPAPATPAPAPSPTVIETIREHQSSLLRALAVALAFVLGVIALRAVRGSAAEAPAPPAGALAAAPAASTLAPPPAAPTPTVPAPNAASPVNPEVRGRVGATVSARPEVAAKLVRAWMREA